MHTYIHRHMQHIHTHIQTYTCIHTQRHITMQHSTHKHTENTHTHAHTNCTKKQISNKSYILLSLPQLQASASGLPRLLSTPWGPHYPDKEGRRTWRHFTVANLPSLLAQQEISQDSRGAWTALGKGPSQPQQDRLWKSGLLGSQSPTAQDHAGLFSHLLFYIRCLLEASLC